MNHFGVWLLSVAFILSLRDAFSDVKQRAVEEDDFTEFGDEPAEKPIDEDHIEVRDTATLFPQSSSPNTAVDLPPLRFLYCVSCGYRQAFEQFSQVVHDKYPHMAIDGGNYPPATWKAYLATAINIAKMATLMVIIMGSNPFAALGWNTPQILVWAQSNKISSCMMVFLLSNMMEGALMSTGAFEIYVGEALIWSKLESGRVPTPQELIHMIDAQLELAGKATASGGSFGGQFSQ